MTAETLPDGFDPTDDEGRAYLVCAVCGLPVYTDPEADDAPERCGCDADDRAGYRFLDKQTAVSHIDHYLK